MYGCAIKNNVITASFCLMFTTSHFQGIKQTLTYVNPGEMARGIFRPHKNLFFSSLHISWNY